MTRKRRRIVIFRSSRNLTGCLVALGRQWSNAERWLVVTSGVETLDEVQAFPPGRVVVYRGSQFFRLLPWLASGTFWHLRRRPFDAAVVLYSNEEGVGYGQLRAIAATLSTTVLIHRPDQSLRAWTPWEGAARKGLTAMVSAIGWIVIGVLVLLPYHAIRMIRACDPRGSETRLEA